ncbi:FecR family protein [Achromobacter seleniivolatilans]|uniref:FecR family protein n=1 Tax=Achromobacter seleniivolatilans TaxID=3047478 RepID=A0ABY9LZZ1_9BURK|nr:FecR family protein [Achromobacter sp. R39]WMD20334.1 FecR family protein [Achromobacter sp. R39]
MPRTNHPSDSPRDQAVYWFSRECLGTLDEQTRMQRDSWLAADPENERQYRSVQASWRVADSVPEDELRAILTQSEAQPARLGRRKFAVGLTAACALMLTAGVFGPRLWAPEAQFTLVVSTEKGERNRYALPDGSLLELNTSTQARVALYPDRREVELLSGEILFTVSPDAGRPFIVQAGSSQVRVTGTRFNVRRDGSEVALAVEEGSVAFSAGSWWNRITRHLTAGFVLRHAQGEPLAVPHQENVSAITAWQRGRLVFRDTPLSQVVAELNRYLRNPLRIDDKKLALLRVAGTLPIDEPESVLQVLPQIAPVIVLYPADGGIVLAPR